MTLGAWIREATARLAAAGRPAAPVEARRLAEAALRLSPVRLVLEDGRMLERDERATLERLVTGRLAGTPLQYLLGRAAFRGLDLEVGPGVFIPRPETEGLVERVLPGLHRVAAHRPPRILELCVGSGAILAALLTECPTALGVGVELMAPAREFARRNLAAAGVAGRATLLAGDLYAPLAGVVAPGGFDLLVANPPYIPAAALPHLPADVRGFEPAEALDGGADGTDVIARIATGAAAWLAPGGRVALEIDESHGARVLELLAAAAIVELEIANDAAGRPRYALGEIHHS